MRKALNRPTDVELSILRVLWDLGPASVRQVHEQLCETRDEKLAYTSVLTMMQTMTEKRLLLRDEGGRSHIYRPAQAREQILKHMVDDLLDRAFGGHAMEFLAAAFSGRKLSAKEREEAARIITEAKEKR